MTPLDERFRDALREVARRARLVALDDPRFAPLVADMTRKYNDPRGALRSAPDQELAARLGFWLPRDVPKVEAAVRELSIAVPTDRALRVLDLGAGLGASHRGLLRALAGRAGRMEVLAVDDDARALGLLTELARTLGGEGSMVLDVRTETASVTSFLPRVRPVDVILVGQVLGELDRDEPEEARLARHADLLSALLAKTHWLVIVEPALRQPARHLQQLRGLLVSRGHHVHAPCLHQAACPLLAREGDWCHEDLSVDLPEWLAPIARTAGLRWEGLTFSHLVVGREARKEGGPRLRAVSGPIVSKGKRELLVCGSPLAAGAHGAKLGRLDRARSDGNAAFDDLARGDVFELEPFAVDDKGRIGATTLVRRISGGAS